MSKTFFYFSHLVNRDTFVICNAGSGSQYRGTYSVVFVIHGTSSNLPEHFIHTHLSALLSCLTKYIGRFTFPNGFILHILPSLLSQHESKGIKMFLCRHKQRIINECNKINANYEHYTACLRKIICTFLMPEFLFRPLYCDRIIRLKSISHTYLD